MAAAPTHFPGKRRRVLYTLPDGQQVAALLRTDLFDTLTSSESVRWLFLSPLAEQPSFRAQFDHPRVELHRLPRVLPPFLDRQIEFLRRELITRRLDPDSVEVIYRRMPAIEPKRYWTHRPIGWLLFQIPGSDRALAFLQDHLTRDRAVEAYLDGLEVDAVVLGSGAVKFPDVLIGRWARRRGLPTYGVIHSWDNLAIKGPTVRSDRLAVWNCAMVEQAQRLFGYHPECVDVTGPPIFDGYANAQPRRTRAGFLKAMGLDPRRRLVTYTTMPPMTCNFSARFVAMLAEWIGADALAFPSQLLVRLHPQDDPSLYECCRGLPRVVIETPGRYHVPASYREAIYYYDPTEGDLEHLRDTLVHSDVVVNVASTITLEAIALDRPVVNLAFNPVGTSWPLSIAEYYRLAHYRPVAEAGAVRLATGEADLRDALDEALLHPERRRHERSALYQSMVTHVDGACARRLGEAILGFLGACPSTRLASVA